MAESFLSPFLWKNKEEMERSLLDTHRSAKTSVGFAGGSKWCPLGGPSLSRELRDPGPSCSVAQLPRGRDHGNDRVGSCPSLSVAAPAIAGCRVGSGPQTGGSSHRPWLSPSPGGRSPRSRRRRGASSRGLSPQRADAVLCPHEVVPCACLCPDLFSQGHRSHQIGAQSPWAHFALTSSLKPLSRCSRVRGNRTQPITPAADPALTLFTGPSFGRKGPSTHP